VISSEAGLSWHLSRGRSMHLKGVGGGSALVALMGGRGRGGLVHPKILITCPGSQGTSCPCSLFMIRVEDPGYSFMLCLGPGPPSLLCMTRANEKSPYAGGTPPILLPCGFKWLIAHELAWRQCPGPCRSCGWPPPRSQRT
jgi:hypothetical protein